MAKSKSKTFQSDAEVAISVAVPGQNPVIFEPGKVRTYTTEDPAVIEALSANPDLTQVKEGKSK